MLSVIVPVYNGAHILPTTVPAMLAQDVPAAWVFVNDGSTDATAQVLADLNCVTPVVSGVTVRVVTHETNRGRAAARNTGIAAAEGTALVFLDADVEPAHGYLAAMSKALEAPGVVAAVSRLVMAEPDPADAYHRYLMSKQRGPRDHGPEEPVSWRYFLSGIAAIRAEALREVGGFDPSYSYGEDMELAARLAVRYPDGLRYAPDAIARLHDIGSLDTALANMEELARDNLPRMIATHASLVGEGGLRLLHPELGWKGRLARLALRPSGARLVRRMLPMLPRGLSNHAVRYLLGTTLVTAYHDATR